MRLSNLLQQILLATVVSTLVIPPHLRPSSRAEAAPNDGELRAADAGPEDALLARVAKLNAVVGLDADSALMDPYFVDSDRQWVEVQVGDKNTVYKFDRMNEGFPLPGSYHLEDTTWSFDEHSLTGELQVERKGRTFIYRHVIKIPGVQSVASDAHFVHVLLANGVTYGLIGAHIGLFNGKESADGGPVLVALENAPTGEPGQIDPSMVIESYDERKPYDFSQLGDYDPKVLRTGDLIYSLPEEDGNQKVVDVLPMQSFTGSALAHTTVLKLREEILTGANPLEATDRAIKAVQSLKQGPAADVLPFGPDGTGFLRTIESEGMSESGRLTSQMWEEHPFEATKLRNRRTDLMLDFLKGASRFAGMLDARSRHPVPEGSEPDPGTLDADYHDYFRKELDAAVEAELKGLTLAERASLRNTKSFLTRLTEKGIPMLVAAASLSAIAYVIPAYFGYHEHESAAFDLTGVGGPKGPTVSYLIKWLSLAGASMAGIFYGLPIVFGYGQWGLDKRRPSGFFKNRQIHMRTGWHSVISVMKKSAAYLLASWRASAANLVGQGKLYNAMRYGMSPIRYWKSGTEDKSGSEKVLQVAKNMLGRGMDPSLVEARRERHHLFCQNLVYRSLVLKLAGESGANTVGELIANHTEAERGNVQARFMVMVDRARQLIHEGELDTTPTLELVRRVGEDREFSGQMERLFEPLGDEEVARLRALKKHRFWTLFWPRLAGNNDLFNRFRSNEASERLASVYSSQFPNDQGPYILIAGLTPGEAGFANIANPDLLVASDSGRLAGVINDRVATEYLFNILAWSSHTPTDELNLEGAAAVSLDQSFLAQHVRSDESNLIATHLATRNPSTFHQDLRRFYGGFINPFRPGFWLGIERLGNKITRDQIKTLKATMITAGLTTTLGYMMDMEGLAQELGHMPSTLEVISIALKKVVMANCFAYIGYRILWAWNAVGLYEMKEALNHRTDRLGRLLAKAFLAIKRYRDGEGSASDVETAMQPIRAFLDQNDINLPDSILLTGDPVDRAEGLAQFLLLNPKVHTNATSTADVTTQQGMGGLTSVIGFFGIALAWSWASDWQWSEVGLLTAATYGAGLGFKYVGAWMRARVSYVRVLKKLNRAVKAYERNPESLDAAADMYQAVLDMGGVYERYDGDQAKQALEKLELGGFSRDADVAEKSRQVIATSLANPPDDNLVIRRCIERFERDAG